MNTRNSRLHRTLCTSAATALACVASLLLGAASASAQATGAFDPRTIDIGERLETWRARHGRSWQAVYEPQTGYARFLYGGRAQAAFAPTSDEQFFGLARRALEDAQELHGVSVATLEDDQVSFLPLAIAGSTDKLSVQLRQRVNGVPVVHGFVNVLFDTAGRLLSIDVTGLPSMSDHPTVPTLDAGQALGAATTRFLDDTSRPVTRTTQPELVIDQVLIKGVRSPRLAWQVEVYSAPAGAESEGFAYYVDAHDGSIVRREARVHHFDVSGTVRTMATPGLMPDTAANAETNQPMPHVTVLAGLAGFAVTDANGNFTIVGANASPALPLTVTVKYEGSWCNTANVTNGEYILTQALTSNTSNVVLMNPNSFPYTPDANAYLWINKLHDWVKSVNPFDTEVDFVASANVNLPLTCNAFFSGLAVNFERAGQCPPPSNATAANSAYSTVIVHEMGHWLNALYGSGNGLDGFGEGNADVFAMYLTDQPELGQDFFGPGSGSIRSGTNLMPYWGDSSTCPILDPLTGFPEVHACGRPLMGALWKVRARLKASRGNATGSVIADELFNSWLNAFNDGQIKSIIETHWLALDDDDGNLANGTPNFLDIDGGFRDQGFPGVGFQLATVFVDDSASPPCIGSPESPFRLLADALPHVTAGGTIMLSHGTYAESPITINQSVTLRRATGTVLLR